MNFMSRLLALLALSNRESKNNPQDPAVAQRFLPTVISDIWLNNWVASNQEATSCNITTAQSPVAIAEMIRYIELFVSFKKRKLSYILVLASSLISFQFPITSVTTCNCFFIMKLHVKLNLSFK